jgi:subtilisin family serine protease
VVAVIDSGIDYNHTELANNIWINSGEYGNGKESNGIDDDNDGYIDDWRGWDFVNDDNNPMDENSYLDKYHGTHVAGIIGAIGNNGSGVAGVTWDVQLMPLRVLDMSGEGNDADIINAIDYATTKGAHISNNSYGGSGYNQSVYNAIASARTAGQLFVAAAGNSSPANNNDGSTKTYPASYGLDNIISVLSTDDDDDISSFSNYGATSVDIGAPGGEDETQNSDNIYSTKYGGGYQYHAGTSMATPYVVGTAALALARIPELTYLQLKTRILDKADYEAGLYGKCVSNGRLNTYNVLYDSAVPDGTPDGLAANWYSWKSTRLSWNDNSSTEIGFDVQREKSGEQQFSTIQSVNKNIVGCTDTTLSGGTNYYKIRAFNMAGGVTSDVLTVTVPAEAPTSPSDLTAESPTLVHHVVLTWQDNATNEQTFVIQRRPSGGGQWTNVATIDPDVNSQYPTLSYTDTQVNQGNFYYRIKATNPNGSSYSNEIYVEVEGI